MYKIFTESGKSIGNGHLSRCLLLYDAIVRSGQQAKIFLNIDGDVSILKDRNYEKINWWNPEVAENLIDYGDYSIIDSYISERTTLEVISKLSKNTLFFDDFDRLDYPKGIIFCPTLLQKDSKFLTGEEFFLVRKDFYLYKKEKLNNKVRKVFLSIGTDVNNCLDDIIETILGLDKTIEINVVTSKQFSNKRVKSFYNLDGYDMAKLMSNCDFSVISAGQTLLENLVIHNPFILILTAENQMRNYRFVQKKGLIDYFLDARNPEFINKFKEIYKKKVLSKNVEKFYDDIIMKSSYKAAENIINILTKEK